MAIKHGTTSITAVKHGTTSLTAVNHGSTSVFPDTPAAYTMTFSKNSYVGGWDSTASATIYVGDYLQVTSGTSFLLNYKKVTCKAGGSSGSTRWTRTATQKADTTQYTYSEPSLYKGTTIGPALSSGTYDGSFTNIYAYATRTTKPVVITFDITYENAGSLGSMSGGDTSYMAGATTMNLGTYSVQNQLYYTYSLSVTCSNSSLVITTTPNTSISGYTAWDVTGTVPTGAFVAGDLTITWQIIGTYNPPICNCSSTGIKSILVRTATRC